MVFDYHTDDEPDREEQDDELPPEFRLGDQFKPVEGYVEEYDDV